MNTSPFDRVRNGVEVVAARSRASVTPHDSLDPGDEDRRDVGPWCSRCHDAFDGPERQCPVPASGTPYVDCGRGGHMFDDEQRPDVGARLEGWVVSAGPHPRVDDMWCVQLSTPGDHVMTSVCPVSRDRAFEQARTIAAALGLAEHPTEHENQETFWHGVK